jgi:hypothetical protein
MDTEQRIHLGDVHFTTELIEMTPANKRVTSMVRAELNPPPTPVPPATSATGAAVVAMVGIAAATGAVTGAAAGAIAGAAGSALASAGAGSAAPSGGSASPDANTVPAQANVPPAPSAAPSRRMTIIGSSGPKDRPSFAAVRYCLYRASATGVWWPLRLLRVAPINASNGPSPVSSAHNSSVMSPLLSPTVSPPAGVYGLRSECSGYVWCGFGELVIDLVPGVSGVLFNCQECKDGLLSVAWTNVSVVVDRYITVVVAPALGTLSIGVK